MLGLVLNLSWHDCQDFSSRRFWLATHRESKYYCVAFKNITAPKAAGVNLASKKILVPGLNACDNTTRFSLHLMTRFKRRTGTGPRLPSIQHPLLDSLPIRQALDARLGHAHIPPSSVAFLKRGIPLLRVLERPPPFHHPAQVIDLTPLKRRSNKMRFLKCTNISALQLHSE
jgi:hypothetical protein